MTFHPPGGWEDPSEVPTTVGPSPAWWHDDRGWEGDGGWHDGDDGWGSVPRRRRGRVVRLTGVVVAAALVLGSAGAALEEVLAGREPAPLPASVVSLAAAGPDRPGTAGHGRVTFHVTDTTDGPVTPTCRVVISRGARQLGRTVVAGVGALAQGAAVTRAVLVPVVAPVGDGARAQVACWT